MKLAAAQITPVVGDIEKNIQIHKEWIESAAAVNIDFLIFPELSITGYSTQQAPSMATHVNDPQFSELQRLSDKNKITIAFGIPLKGEDGTKIGLGVYQPSSPPVSYAKQILDPDELPYFVAGSDDKIFQIKGAKLAPAICFESLQPQHAEKANSLGADIYIVSSAKSESGIQQANSHFPSMAKLYEMPIIFSNSVGPGDGFQSVGQSGIWDSNGRLLGKLNDSDEGVIIWDSANNEITRLNK